jgi:myo-inositol 2-dehydrogenase/D-chiro-inositol 1-dehydrogenase
MTTGAHVGLVGAGRIGAMHARHLAALPGVQRLTIADADARLSHRVADELAVGHADGVTGLLAAGIDALVIAAATPAHPSLIAAAVDAGIPVLCEKPVASDVASSLPVLAHIRAAGGVVQIGHQRRFDRGYLEARRAYRAGELGWIHSLRAVTCDAAPPPVAFLATSGGLFRDVSVHDFDVISWLTGRRIVEVYARGSNNGDPAIGDVGDVDTALAVCTLDDGTMATVTASRYNGAGHDVRLEIQGSRSSVMVGLDDHAALRSAEPGVAFPTGRPHATFAERFAEAYRDELRAFLELVRGERDNPCTPEEAVAASVVADAAQESLASGRPVQVPTIGFPVPAGAA